MFRLRQVPRKTPGSDLSSSFNLIYLAAKKKAASQAGYQWEAVPFIWADLVDAANWLRLTTSRRLSRSKRRKKQAKPCFCGFCRLAHLQALLLRWRSALKYHQFGLGGLISAWWPVTMILFFATGTHPPKEQKKRQQSKMREKQSCETTKKTAHESQGSGLGCVCAFPGLEAKIGGRGKTATPAGLVRGLSCFPASQRSPVPSRGNVIQTKGKRNPIATRWIVLISFRRP